MIVEAEVIVTDSTSEIDHEERSDEATVVERIGERVNHGKKALRSKKERC